MNPHHLQQQQNQQQQSFHQLPLQHQQQFQQQPPFRQHQLLQQQQFRYQEPLQQQQPFHQLQQFQHANPFVPIPLQNFSRTINLPHFVSFQLGNSVRQPNVIPLQQFMEVIDEADESSMPNAVDNDRLMDLETSAPEQDETIEAYGNHNLDHPDQPMADHSEKMFDVDK
uniref:Uncharacterized protein n=1 Tax=Panagrolaimus superbus TaxID=310955 RepID=A0A914XUV7_9BILA